MKLSSGLPRQLEFQHIQRQLLRSSSSVPANFRAAFRGRSKPEFISKLGIAEEECDESQFWLEMLKDGAVEIGVRLPADTIKEIERLISEANQLLRIIISARKTAKAR
jgi:four helix bundle protein